jgi:hypothetical protein
MKSLTLILAVVLTVFPLSGYAGSGRINSDGTIDFTILFRYPPTPADVNFITNEVVGASQLLWDATEGQIRFGTVRLTVGADGNADADVWIYLRAGRAHSQRNALGTLGAHITGFRTDLEDSAFDRYVLAHELGHLAFGLSDEYPEERKIGCASMGYCIQPGSVDAQNQCLMQLERDESFWTEFCTPANHDLVRGDGIGCPTMGCTAFCEYWNSTTMTWEVSLQEHSNHKSCWQQLQDSFASRITSFRMPTPLPQADPPPGFMPPRWIDESSALLAQTVVLVLDRSGSMSDHPDRDRGEICNDGVDTDGNGNDNTPNCSDFYRFDYLKAAARTWLELARNQGVQAGIISFNDMAIRHGAIRPVNDMTIGGTDGLRTTVDNLVWGGDTAIGSALELAPSMFQDAMNVRNKSVLLVSDGDNNRGPDPLPIASNLRQQGIRVFSVGTGKASRGRTLGEIADHTDGELVDSQSARTLVNAFSRQWAHQRGMLQIIPERYYKYPYTNRITFPLAAGVTKISLILAGSMEDGGLFGLHTIFNGPAGPGTNHFDTLIAHPNLRIVNDSFFQLIEITAPNPGTWDVEILPAPGAAPVQTGHLTLLAQDEQSHLFATLDRHLVSDPRVPLTLTVMPIYHTFLRDLEILSAVVRRPDGTTFPLSLLPALEDRMYTAVITDLAQEGNYSVEVSMRTGPDTSNDPGESLRRSLPFSTVTVPIFEATALEHFVVRLPGGPVPNDTPETATHLSLNGGCAIAQGYFTPDNVQDYYQFSAPAGARVWITVDTGGEFLPVPTSRDSLLTLFKADGISVIEEDDNDGSGNGSDSTTESGDASAVAGRALDTAGPYFIRVSPRVRNEHYMPYKLYLNLTTNAPLSETEPNDSPLEANAILPFNATSGVRTGTVFPPGDIDYYYVYATAGSVLHVSADLDPLRNGTSLTDVSLLLLAPDGLTTLYLANSSSASSVGEPAGEGFCFRVAETGFYYVAVIGKTTGTGLYDLMVAIKAPHNSPLVLTMAAELAGSTLRLRFPTEPGKLYSIDQADALKGQWKSVSSVTGSGGFDAFVLPMNQTRSFFRVSTSQ